MTTSPNPTVCEFHNGPLDGLVHEIQSGWEVPNMIGMPDPQDSTIIHWYLVNKQFSPPRAYFVHSQKKEGVK